tara:strand:- start:98 stop:424 length:327 start_codon:yes stop_codon:yes gene_type:complete
MKFKFKIFIYLSFFGFILSSCSTVQKAFDPERKNSSEEFLVEKKSPLSMPPDYNELPIPKSKSNDEKETATSLESLIIKDNNNSNQNNQETEIDKNLEKSILDEIIKN